MTRVIRYKDLCIDARDPAAAAGFWSPVLGLRVEPDRAETLLRGDQPEHAVWINAVDEPRTAKHRVHLDVHTASIEELIARGATVTGEFPHWTLMADPEGGEFCAFVRTPDPLPAYRLYEIVVDAADQRRIGAWWAERFGGRVEHDPGDDFCWLEDVGLPFGLVFGNVPEPKTVKNRVHFDVWGDVGELEAAGARVLRRRDEEIAWDVLTDPEGNEFCVFPPTS